MVIVRIRKTGNGKKKPGDMRCLESKLVNGLIGS